MRENFLFILLLLLAFFSCSSENSENTPDSDAISTFDKAKWRVKEGNNYPFRKQMVNDVLYSDTIRKLNKAEIIDLLGAPDRSENGHLYYNITSNRLGMMVLNSQTLVIKFLNDDKIEWIKIHG